jgi:hypothetical protein
MIMRLIATRRGGTQTLRKGYPFGEEHDINKMRLNRYIEKLCWVIMGMSIIQFVGII